MIYMTDVEHDKENNQIVPIKGYQINLTTYRVDTPSGRYEVDCEYTSLDEIDVTPVTDDVEGIIVESMRICHDALEHYVTNEVEDMNPKQLRIAQTLIARFDEMIMNICNSLPCDDTEE